MNTRYEQIIAAFWHAHLNVCCQYRGRVGTSRKPCLHPDGTGCGDQEACPRIKSMRADMQTPRMCYRDQKGLLVYMQRFAHNVRPWFIWHEEKSRYPGAARQVGADLLLAGAQAKLDRMASRYGWTPCETPEWVRDEVG